MTFEIIWPEHRFVTEHQIRVWYSDAVANKEVTDIDLDNADDMAWELHSAGLITLGRGSLRDVDWRLPK